MFFISSYNFIFFDGLAKYIEGEVHWSFENDDESGYVTFEEGKCMIHTGQMQWTEWEPTTGIRKSDMSKEMKKLLIMNKIDEKNIVDLVKWAIELGIVKEEDLADKTEEILDRKCDLIGLGSVERGECELALKTFKTEEFIKDGTIIDILK